MTNQDSSVTLPATVKIHAPARLHLGFLDLGASLGRRFGSLGLAINPHQVILSVSEAETLAVCAPDNADLEQTLRNLFKQFQSHFLPDKIRQPEIALQTTIPPHSGLGSGTQLALTLGFALAEFYGLDLPIDDIATVLGRGKRSGIGLNTFKHGGFIIDGGLAANSQVPPMLLRQDYPADWRIILVFDATYQGVHGNAEIHAFQRLPEFPKQHSQAICHLTLMQLLPALAEKNIDAFGEAVTHIQSLIGEHFAPVQGGQYTSPRVASILSKAKQLGHRGIAQSSWGPTGCIFVDSQQSAETLVQQLKTEINTNQKLTGLTLQIATGTNKGAVIDRQPASQNISQLRSHHG